MFNKNDPLISAVQEVMKRNHAEREAAKVVNEKFGVYDRKALPHERQGEWDAAFKSVLNESDDMGPVKKKDNESVEYEHKTSGKRSKFTKHPGDNWKVVKEELKGNQHRIDVASSTGEKKPDGKLTKHDFEHLRSMKEEEQLDELKGYRSKKGQKLLTRVQKRATDRLVKATDPMWTSKSGMSDKDKKTAKRNSDVARMADDRMDEEHLNEKSPPGRADQVETLKKKFPEKRAFQIAWSSYNKSKKKKIDEGFNNRHDLSENASVKEQVVAVLNEDDIDSYENRMTAGLGQPYTPYGGGRFGGGNAKTGTLARRPVRIDPGLRNINTRTGEQIKTSSGPKTRKRVVSKKKPPQQQAVQQQGQPPSGTFLDNLAKGRRNVGMDKPKPAANLTAGAARRPAGQSAPPMRQQGSMLPPPKSSSRIIRRGGAGLAAGAALELATSSTPVGNQTPAAAAATQTSGPSFEKTGRGNAPAVQKTTTQPDYDKMTFGQAFKSARETAKKQGDPSMGKFKYKGKEYQTNIKGTGTAKKPQEKYQLASKLKDVTPVSATQTSVKPTVSSSPAPNVKPARNSTLAAPSATAATTMATATKAAGQMAVDRMKAQNLAKSQTSSMFGGSVNKPKPFDQFQDKGKYAGDMRDTKGPAAAERLANPTFVPTPSPGSTYRRNSTLAAPSAVAAGQNASPSPAPNIQPARNSTLAAPSAMAATATAKAKLPTFGPK